MIKPRAIVVDIDGTLILFDGDINEKIYDLILKYRNRYFYKIILLTARSEHYRAETIKELQNNKVKYDKLFMNNTKKFPPEYKKGVMINDILPYYNVIRVFDDDESNIDEFQKLGLEAVLVDSMSGEFLNKF